MTSKQVSEFENGLHDLVEAFENQFGFELWDVEIEIYPPWLKKENRVSVRLRTLPVKKTKEAMR